MDGGIPRKGAGGSGVQPLHHTLQTRTSAYDKLDQPESCYSQQTINSQNGTNRVFFNFWPQNTSLKCKLKVDIYVFGNAELLQIVSAGKSLTHIVYYNWRVFYWLHVWNQKQDCVWQLPDAGIFESESDLR